MNDESGGVVARKRLDFVSPSLRQHFCGRDGHVVHEGLFILPVRARDAGDGNSPGIDLVLIELDDVGFMRQHLAEAVEAEAPGTRLAQRLLVFSTESRLPDAASPIRPAAAALETIAAQERRLALPDIAEAGHVDAVGPVADRVAIGGPVDPTVGAA